MILRNEAQHAGRRMHQSTRVQVLIALGAGAGFLVSIPCAVGILMAFGVL